MRFCFLLLKVNQALYLFLAATPKVSSLYSKKNNQQQGTITKSVMHAIIAVACVVVFSVFMVVLIILYRRKKLYGGFYIFTLPPAPDYIKKLDPGKSLIEQTHKLPYDPEWEFPRERLKLGKFSFYNFSFIFSSFMRAHAQAMNEYRGGEILTKVFVDRTLWMEIFDRRRK